VPSLRWKLLGDANGQSGKNRGARTPVCLHDVRIERRKIDNEPISHCSGTYCSNSFMVCA
jgi:hypothetical protein